MGCVQIKQKKSSKNTSESMQNSNKQMIVNNKNNNNNNNKKSYKQKDEVDPQIIRSLSNISDEKNINCKNSQAKSCNSSKQTGVGETMKLDDHSKSNISTKIVPRYPVTIEYVLARKSFVESQNIPDEHRLNMFPAPKLKGIEKSSLYYRRKSTTAEIMRPNRLQSAGTRPAVKSHKF